MKRTFGRLAVSGLCLLFTVGCELPGTAGLGYDSAIAFGVEWGAKGGAQSKNGVGLDRMRVDEEDRHFFDLICTLVVGDTVSGR